MDSVKQSPHSLLVGFDLDGVIIDYTELKIRGAAKLGITIKPEETPSEILKQKLEPEAYIGLKHMVYDDPDTALAAALMPYTEDTLSSLQSVGANYYLISKQKDPDRARKLLEHLGIWGRYFDVDNTVFVKEDREKNDIAKHLGIDNYIDDQIKILRLLEVRNKYLFDPYHVHADTDWYKRVGTLLEFLTSIGF